jgi:hypothetical protein
MELQGRGTRIDIVQVLLVPAQRTPTLNSVACDLSRSNSACTMSLHPYSLRFQTLCFHLLRPADTTRRGNGRQFLRLRFTANERSVVNSPLVDPTSFCDSAADLVDQPDWSALRVESVLSRSRLTLAENVARWLTNGRSSSSSSLSKPSSERLSSRLLMATGAGLSPKTELGTLVGRSDTGREGRRKALALAARAAKSVRPSVACENVDALSGSSWNELELPER